MLGGVLRLGTNATRYSKLRFEFQSQIEFKRVRLGKRPVEDGALRRLIGRRDALFDAARIVGDNIFRNRL